MRTLLLALPLLLLACAPAPTVEEGFVASGEHSLYYKTMGEGDPIVVLHGGPGFDHRQFLPFIWELADGHQVILYDQRGTGLSTGPVDSASITMGAFLEDIEAIREHFGLERMNLLGHSWGGILAMHYALAHEDRLKSLILCSTSATAESFPEMRANYEARRDPGDGERLLEIYGSEEFKTGDPDAVERFWRLYFRPYFADPLQVERMDLHFTPNTIANSGVVAQQVLQSIGAFDLHEDLKALRCPTLIVHGDADPMPVKYAERLHECIEGSELVILGDVGHWLFVDGTEGFRRAVLDFLGR